MFFLLRVAFWLTIVLALLPSGGSQPVAGTGVKATEAFEAAGAAVSDVSSFCDRQREACAVGAQAAVAIGQRAQAGAKMVFDFFSEQTSRGVTGSVSEAKLAGRQVPHSPGSQSTLKPSDLDPTWRGPIGSETIPLPRSRKDHRNRA